MAGIGFTLRKLYRQDNLSGLMQACFHSAIASAGPWLFTVVALGVIGVIGKNLIGVEALMDFRSILIYNFSFSLVISGPVFLVATRYLADRIYDKDVSTAPAMLIDALMLLWGAELLIAAPFYFIYANISFGMAVSATVNLLLLSAVWLVGIFISALKNYLLITHSFIAGMVVAVIACYLLAEPYGAVGTLNGFSIGISVIIGLLLAIVLAEYPYPIKRSFSFTGYFSKYWELTLSGIIYNMAIWVDKWIMWFAPEASKLPSGLIIYPYYDTAMFMAYITTIPAMAMFLFNSETSFFEHYMRYYRDIKQKANYMKIQKNHSEIARSIFGSAWHFFLLQGSIAFFGVLMAPQIIGFLHSSYLQIGMLRYGLLGAFFQVLTLFLLILLYYFDSRRSCLLIQSVFLATNAVFTYFSLQAGFGYYGYGYFLSCLATFILAAVIVTKYVAHLPYHTFITSNASVRGKT